MLLTQKPRVWFMAFPNFFDVTIIYWMEKGWCHESLVLNRTHPVLERVALQKSKHEMLSQFCCILKFISRAFIKSLYLQWSYSVNGGFTTWTDWSPCRPFPNGTWVQSRGRSCTNPVPAYGGLDCVGSLNEVTSDGCVKGKQWAKTKMECIIDLSRYFSILVSTPLNA